MPHSNSIFLTKDELHDLCELVLAEGSRSEKVHSKLLINFVIVRAVLERKVSSNLKCCRVNLGVQEVLPDLASGLALRKALRNQEHPGATVGDDEVVRLICCSQTHTCLSNHGSQFLQAVTSLVHKSIHRVVHQAADGHIVTPPLLRHSDRSSHGTLDGEWRMEVVCLEVEVIDCTVSSQAVEPSPEVRVVRCLHHGESHQHRVRGGLLRQEVQYTRHKENMAILDR
mmetsp:Transcript_7853/g.20255  ORF Transcript_7853/g.20255 Transcript_7853/m.20255 type:complete len:227 (+) Transcript_7853:234-914(+)